MTSRAPISDGTDLADRLRRWVGSGLITSDQAERILAAEQVPAEPAAPSRASLVAEALGYVGGVLVLIGAVTATDRYWSQLGVGGRLGIAFGAAVLLLATGAGVPARRTDVARRLRGVCWLVSVALFGTGLALLGDEVLDLRGESLTLLAAAGTAAYAAVLWWRHRGVLQQAAVLAALAVTAASAVVHLSNGAEDPVLGLAVWGVGAAWSVLGWGRVIAARSAAYVLGGAAIVVGAQFTVEDGWGATLAVGSVVALVAAGAWLRELVLLGVGAVGTLITVPAVLGQYFPDTLTIPLALVGCGVLLVAAAAYTARLRRAAAPRRQVEGTRVAALAAVAVIAVAVVGTVLALGR